MPHDSDFFAENEESLVKFMAELSQEWKAGDIVLLSGPLGAGKTTAVRGVLSAMGFAGTVVSPTYNLIQLYPTTPPVMHADLYRVKGYEGIGLEEYFESHLCFIEWPDRLSDLVIPKDCWQIEIGFFKEGRRVLLRKPTTKTEI